MLIKTEKYFFILFQREYILKPIFSNILAYCIPSYLNCSQKFTTVLVLATSPGDSRIMVCPFCGIWCTAKCYYQINDVNKPRADFLVILVFSTKESNSKLISFIAIKSSLACLESHSGFLVFLQQFYFISKLQQITLT